MTPIYYAVGDVHGRDDLLEQLHAHIREFHGLSHGDRPAKVIHLGDYIDGGAHSVDVLDRLMRGLPGMEMLCLLGNHEAMMLECLTTDDRLVWGTWLSNGGDQTLDSLGLFLRFGDYDPDALARALGAERVAWLRSLPINHAADGNFFVHAGIVPGVPLDQQRVDDMLWIRGRFLDSDVDHGVRVIHGHTPSDEPVVRPNRICVDTGAVPNGLLTCVVLDGTEAPLFLRAVGRPGRGD